MANLYRVLEILGDGDKLRGYPASNIVNIATKKGNFGTLTINVSNEDLQKLISRKTGVCLFVWDKDDYKAAELEAEAEEKPDL